MTQYAQDFYEIPDAISENDELRSKILDLVADDPIPGKVAEENDRTEALREILTEFFKGNISLEESYQRISDDLPRYESRHAENNRVFPSNWEERLSRTQISRFYNQGVLLGLQEQGEEQCYIPHSEHEDIDSPCTLQLAGGTASVDYLISCLHRAYREGKWHDDVMIPEHPHCTHTATPVED